MLKHSYYLKHTLSVVFKSTIYIEIDNDNVFCFRVGYELKGNSFPKILLTVAFDNLLNSRKMITSGIRYREIFFLETPSKSYQVNMFLKRLNTKYLLFRM